MTRTNAVWEGLQPIGAGSLRLPALIIASLFFWPRNFLRFGEIFEFSLSLARRFQRPRLTIGMNIRCSWRVLVRLVEFTGFSMRI